MNKINISVIDQVIYSATPFILFLILSNSTNVSTFAILSSTYTINILFTSLYQAYLVEPVITHWDKLDNLELSYVNLYLSAKNLKDAVFSIHHQTLRVDIWTMTSGGNTTREFIPAGLCKDVKIDDILSYIEGLK